MWLLYLHACFSHIIAPTMRKLRKMQGKFGKETYILLPASLLKIVGENTQGELKCYRTHFLGRFWTFRDKLKSPLSCPRLEHKPGRLLTGPSRGSYFLGGKGSLRQHIPIAARSSLNGVDGRRNREPGQGRPLGNLHPHPLTARWRHVLSSSCRWT